MHCWDTHLQISALCLFEFQWSWWKLKKTKCEITNGFCPLSSGWSKAGWRWDSTQSITSPSGLCSKKTRKLRSLSLKHNKNIPWKSKVYKCLNCLHRWLVDLPEISSDPPQLVQLWTRVKRLVGRWRVAGIWHNGGWQDRAKQWSYKKESNKKHGNDGGSVVGSRWSKFRGMFLCCCFLWCNNLCLYALGLSCCVMNLTRWLFSLFCPWNWISLHVHTKLKNHSSKKNPNFVLTSSPFYSI